MTAPTTHTRPRFSLVRIVAVTLACSSLIFFSTPAPTQGQGCSDGSVCTTNDVCREGNCTGSPLDAGSCDDGRECTTGDSCDSGVCHGTPVVDGAACHQGCGRCISGFCAPNLGNTGNVCNDGNICTLNDRCQFGLCFGALRTCPNTDSNPCTLEVCNPVDGNCMATGLAPCGDCQTCADIGTGQFRCDSGPDGTPCNDFNECTYDGSCGAGQCHVGEPVIPGEPTRTATATPTRDTRATATPSTGLCLGDCNRDQAVTVDEIIAGVNIALGNLSLATCSAFDSNRDAFVTVEEIVRSVNLALNGCG